jgi:hypothetical protein
VWREKKTFCSKLILAEQSVDPIRPRSRRREKLLWLSRWHRDINLYGKPDYRDGVKIHLAAREVQVEKVCHKHMPAKQLNKKILLRLRNSWEDYFFFWCWWWIMTLSKTISKASSKSHQNLHLIRLFFYDCNNETIENFTVTKISSKTSNKCWTVGESQSQVRRKWRSNKISSLEIIKKITQKLS